MFDSMYKLVAHTSILRKLIEYSQYSSYVYEELRSEMSTGTNMRRGSAYLLPNRLSYQGYTHFQRISQIHASAKQSEE